MVFLSPKYNDIYFTFKGRKTDLLTFCFSGDRIVKVNGQSIIGKTYSQVIALIQNRYRSWSYQLSSHIYIYIYSVFMYCIHIYSMDVFSLIHQKH